MFLSELEDEVRRRQSGATAHPSEPEEDANQEDEAVPDAEDDDEPLFRLDDHRFNPGEYVSVTEHDGVERTDQVVDIRKASGLSFKSASVIIHACRNSRKQWS